MSYHNLMTGDDTRLSILPASHLTSSYKFNLFLLMTSDVRVQAGVELSPLTGFCMALSYSDNQ